MISCPTCGEKLSDTAFICSSCGMEIRQAEKPTAEVGPPSPENTQPLVQLPAISEPAVKPGKAKAYIALKRGGVTTGDIYYLGTEVTIGRFDTETGPVDVDLASIAESTYISRNHAKIHSDDSGQWFLTDLGSNNGTFIWTEGNKPKRIQTGEPVNIKDGDEIALGNARFEFHVMQQI